MGERGAKEADALVLTPLLLLQARPFPGCQRPLLGRLPKGILAHVGILACFCMMSSGPKP